VKDVVARAVALHAIRYSFNTGDVFVPKVQASKPQISWAPKIHRLGICTAATGSTGSTLILSGALKGPCQLWEKLFRQGPHYWVMVSGVGRIFSEGFQAPSWT